MGIIIIVRVIYKCVHNHLYVGTMAIYKYIYYIFFVDGTREYNVEKKEPQDVEIGRNNNNILLSVERSYNNNKIAETMIGKIFARNSYAKRHDVVDGKGNDHINVYYYDGNKYIISNSSYSMFLNSP